MGWGWDRKEGIPLYNLYAHNHPMYTTTDVLLICGNQVHSQNERNPIPDLKGQCHKIFDVFFSKQLFLALLEMSYRAILICFAYWLGYERNWAC